jgi:hypothetical protein
MTGPSSIYVSQAVAASILNLSTPWSWSALLPPGESSWYPLDGRLAGPQAGIESHNQIRPPAGNDDLC